MTSEEIKATIDRLKAIPCDGTPAVYRVASAFMDMDINVSYSDIGLRNRLIGLLKQADPETHMELPVDANGEVIRIGDRVDLTKNVRGLTVTGVGTSSDSDSDMGVFIYDDYGYTWYNALFLRHYHKPTVEDVLAEMLDTWGELPSNASNEAIIAEYADKIRELIGND